MRERGNWRAPKALKVAVFLIVEKISVVWEVKPIKQAVKTKTSMEKSLRKASALASDTPEEEEEEEDDFMISFFRCDRILGQTCISVYVYVYRQGGQVGIGKWLWKSNGLEWSMRAWEEPRKGRGSRH